VTLLIEIIAALVRVLLPWVVAQSRPTAQDADPDLQIRNRLRAAVRRHWSPSSPDNPSCKD
jgi:hypothetical protein